MNLFESKVSKLLGIPIRSKSGLIPRHLYSAEVKAPTGRG